jgi:hypothetical protein
MEIWSLLWKLAPLSTQELKLLDRVGIWGIASAFASALVAPLHAYAGEKLAPSFACSS